MNLDLNGARECCSNELSVTSWLGLSARRGTARHPRDHDDRAVQSVAFQHIRELHPTRAVHRDAARVSPLASDIRDLGGFSAPVREGRVATLEQLLDAWHTDAFLVLHRGRIATSAT